MPTFNAIMPKLGPLQRPLRFLRQQLPPLNFITIHYLYFIATCLISSILVYGTARPIASLGYTDSLFLAVSAMTEAGLNPVNLSGLNTFQQVVLFFLIIMGSAIWVSAFVVGVRRIYFEKKFLVYAEEKQRKESEKGGRSRSRKRRTLSLTRKATASEAITPSAPQSERSSNEVHLDSIAAEKPRYHLDRAVTPSARHGGSAVHGFPSEKEEEALADEKSVPPLSPSQTSGIHFRDDTVFRRQHAAQSPPPRRAHHGIFNAQGVGALSSASLHPMSPTRPPSSTDVPPEVPAQRPRQISRYFSSVGGWASRNSQFHGLTEEERERLGGYEYRAVKMLSWIVPVYFVLWQLLGALGCAAWVATNRAETARANGLNPWWVGAFNAVSAFNNSGMSLLDANMTAFQDGYYLLLTMGLLILAGNTAFPIFLRLIVWCMYKYAQYFQDDSGIWAERAATIKFLLDHPRRCYTNLFPSRHTWWLLLCVITLNAVDWAAFEILNIGNSGINDPGPALSTGERVIDGLFQALAVRSGGFYVVPIANVRIALQVLYVVMMYISVYPVVITMRNSNVYEERSLGIYAEDQGFDPALQNRPSLGLVRMITDHLVGGGGLTGGNTAESNGTFVRQQLRAQLAHDAWTIVLALFLIMIIESGKFDSDPAHFSVFNFLFEIVSGYGCVGISVGTPSDAYSFCGTWQKLSKLILCVVMLRGRHRGLPVAIDRAITLPGELNDAAEEEDGHIRLARTMSRGQGDV